MLLITAILTLWMAGAIYFDLTRGANWGALLGLGFILGIGALFTFWQPIWQPFATLLGVFFLFVSVWSRQKPSHDRDWEPTVARLPHAVRNGDEITFSNVRNCEFHSQVESTIRYETRSYHLDNLCAIDAIFFNWGSALMSHPVLVFDFGADGRVCVSIEVRYQRGQKYSILRSLYHFYELIFLVADERDVILRRTKFGPRQKAHLYRLVTTPDERRSTFLDYVDAINSIYHQPRWYHGLCTNCTTAFYQLPSRQRRWDWRVLANARLDRALYSTGRIDRSLPFAQLRQNAFLNDVANNAPEVGFGDHIRRELERRRHDR